MLRVSNSTEEASGSTRSNFKLSAFVNVSGPLAAHTAMIFFSLCRIYRVKVRSESAAVKFSLEARKLFSRALVGGARNSQDSSGTPAGREGATP